MHRRLLITALACGLAAAVLAQPRPRHKISAAQLHEAMGRRFPVRTSLAGLLDLEVSAPRLLLLPGRQKVGATLVLEAGGRRVQPPRTGEMDVAFALRYEASDRTLRAHQLEILDVRWPGLPSDTAQALQALLPALAREAVGEFILHQFSPRELGLADTMGFEPETIVVVDDGLVVVFGVKQAR
jgi:hypothetical protein